MKKFFILLVIILSAACLYANELNYDKDILKRTPIIDGKIQQGEWDIFYRFSTDNDTVTAYANWDYEHFYLAASANSITDIAVAFDINCDGWSVGDDNYLLMTDENGAINIFKAVKVADDKITLVSFQLPAGYKIIREESVSNGKTNVEMCFNANLFGISNFEKDKTHFNFSVKTEDTDWSAFNPSVLQDNTVGCRLVNHKSACLEPLEMDLYVTRERIVAGSTLDGKVKIKNRSKEPVTIKEIILAGEGFAEDMISSSKIIVGEIKPGKTFEREYHSKILPESPIGCRVLGCEIYADNMKVGGALRSFEIITPVRFLPHVPKDICYTNDKIIRCGVRAISYSEFKHSTGYASITLPEGWELEGNNKNKFDICGYNKYVDLIFRITPPLGTVGHVRLPVTVTMKDSEQTVYCDFNIVQSK